MTLCITETSWGINRKTGKRSESMTAEVKFECKLGRLPDFGKGKRNFFIDEMGDDYIVLALKNEKNPSTDRSWRLGIGENGFYLPRSCDGGYKYSFELTE